MSTALRPSMEFTNRSSDVEATRAAVAPAMTLRESTRLSELRTAKEKDPSATASRARESIWSK